MKSTPILKINSHGYYEAYWREDGVSMRRSMHTKDQATGEREFASFLLRTTKQAIYTVAQSWHLRERETLHSLAAPQRVRDAWKVLLPHFGHIEVEDIKPEHVSSYVAKRIAEGRKTSTARRELVELLATLHYMVTTKRLNSSQIPAITLPPESAARPHYLSAAQCTHVFAEAARRRPNPDQLTRLELFLWIAAHTGQRKRAVEQLEWRQVDFERGVIHFQKEGERITKKRKASVPIRQALRELLEKEKALSDTSYVLRHPGSIRTTFETFMASLELPHVTPHVLRHTFVSQLLMKDVPVYTVSKLAAVSVKRIEQTYGHLSDEHLREAMEKV